MKNLPRCLLVAFVFLLLGGAVAARADDITVAVAGPITGEEAAFGEQMRRGFEKAVADINAKGGVLGQQIKTVEEDDVCDPKQAVSVANDLVAKKVAVVIGHFCSSTSIPASNVYSDGNIIEITPGSTNPQYTERGLTNVFRVCGRDDDQGPTSARYVLAHFKGEKIAVVDDKSTYGKGLADQFKAALNAGGVTEVVHDEVTAGSKDFSPLVSKLKEAQADILFYGGYDAEAGLIVRQMRDQGLKTILMGGDALNTQDYWSITGAAGEGTLFTFGPDAELLPQDADLVKWFQSQKYEPEGYTLYTYAALQAWAQAVAKAGSTDTAKVEAALRANQFDTAIGPVGFNAKGDVTAPGYIVYAWSGGKYAYARN